MVINHLPIILLGYIWKKKKKQTPIASVLKEEALFLKLSLNINSPLNSISY